MALVVTAVMTAAGAVMMVAGAVMVVAISAVTSSLVTATRRIQVITLYIQYRLVSVNHDLFLYVPVLAFSPALGSAYCKITSTGLPLFPLKSRCVPI